MAMPSCGPTRGCRCRILDHKRFLEAMELPADVKARTVVAIHESEGIDEHFFGGRFGGACSRLSHARDAGAGS